MLFFPLRCRSIILPPKVERRTYKLERRVLQKPSMFLSFQTMAPVRRSPNGTFFLLLLDSVSFFNGFNGINITFTVLLSKSMNTTAMSSKLAKGFGHTSLKSWDIYWTGNSSTSYLFTGPRVLFIHDDKYSHIHMLSVFVSYISETQTETLANEEPGKCDRFDNEGEV